ncbi:MAG: hypothetical protein HQM12_23870, partial [SAR324 cluster bacterium]|nr:hypothetical protein [SAR324 cluster bacterium]
MKQIKILLLLMLYSGLSVYLNSCFIENKGIEADEVAIRHDADEVAIRHDNISAIGTNTSVVGLLYYNNPDWLLIDQYAKSSQWYPLSESRGGWNKGVILESDSNGWPTSVDGDTILYQEMLRGIDGHYPTGTYAIYWEGGGGIISMSQTPYGDAGNPRCFIDGPVVGTLRECTANRAFFDVALPTDKGIALSIIPDSAATYSSSNYIKNIRVIMPGGVCGRSITDLDYTEYCQSSRGGSGQCDMGETCFDFDDVQWNRYRDSVSEINNPKVLFHPYSLKRLEAYRAIRMMNLQMINGNPISAWNDRSIVTYYSLGLNNGAPPEYLIALSNVLDTDIWFNIPHLASDDYVRQLATLTVNNLEADRKIYLEYTNEHFNTDPGFSQSTYMLEQANALGLGQGESNMNKRSLYYAKRSVEIFDIWNDVFGTASHRTIRVLGAFMPVSELTKTMMGVAGVPERVDVIATGAYFGVYLAYTNDYFSTISTWSVDQMFNELNNGGLTNDRAKNGAMAELYSYLDEHMAVAQSYNKPLIVYEGGQHLSNFSGVENKSVEALLYAANHDPRMGALYTELLNYWKSIGGREFFHFNHIDTSKFGNFGSLEYIDSTREESPKYDALQDFIETTPCW